MNYGITDKFLMDTESALLCDACTNDANFEATKAYYIPKSFSEAIAEGVKGNLWFSIAGWRNSQLINQDLTLRPGYYAYKFAYKELAEATFVKSIDFGGVRGYEFKNHSKTLWLLWSMSSSQSVNLPTSPTAIFDVSGTPQTITGTTVSVTLQPLYIEFSN
jgi:hypothetical protein